MPSGGALHLRLVATAPSRSAVATWSLCDATGWPGDDSCEQLLAWCWTATMRTAASSSSTCADAPAAARVHLPWDDLGGTCVAPRTTCSPATCSSVRATSWPPTASTCSSHPGAPTCSPGQRVHSGAPREENRRGRRARPSERRDDATEQESGAEPGRHVERVVGADVDPADHHEGDEDAGDPPPRRAAGWRRRCSRSRRRGSRAPTGSSDLTTARPPRRIASTWLVPGR